MPKPKRVWVVGDSSESLDRVMFEWLQKELDEKVEIELIERESENEPGVVNALKSVFNEITEIGDLGGRQAKRIADQLERADVVPDVVISTSPDDVAALAVVARRGGPRPVRVAVVRAPSLGRTWLRAPADLFCVPDDHAKPSAGKRRSSTRVTGVPVETAYAPALDAPAARLEHGLDADAHVLFITADSFERHELNPLMVQLALAKIELEVLFEVDDEAVADDLRRLAPAHGLSASIVPADASGGAFWSLAHLVVGRAKPQILYQSRAAGVPMLVAPTEGLAEREFGEGLAASGAGRVAESMATLAVDLDLTLEPQRYESLSERVITLNVDNPGAKLAAVIADALEGIAMQQGGEGGLPKGLERISRARTDEPHLKPDHFDEALRTATEVRDKSEIWGQRARIARSHGDEELALEADKRASRHREVLNRLLETLRPEDWSDSGEATVLDEELEALRRRILPEKNIEARLRSLEVEDELQELKDRLKQE